MNITVADCSFSADNICYPYIVADHYNATLKNLAVHGNSNYNIFMSAANELATNTPNMLIVQWSALNRIWAYPSPGIETCSVTNGLTKSFGSSKLATSKGLVFTEKQLIEFGELYSRLNCDYHHILTLIDYCNVLCNLAKDKCRLIFINGLIPWTADLVLEDNDLDKLSAYTKEILNFDTSPDDEIYRFLIALKKKIKTLDQELWINMFDSMLNNRIDTISKIDYHPGPKTHKALSNKIILSIFNSDETAKGY